MPLDSCQFHTQIKRFIVLYVSDRCSKLGNIVAQQNKELITVLLEWLCIWRTHHVMRNSHQTTQQPLQWNVDSRQQDYWYPQINSLWYHMYVCVCVMSSTWKLKYFWIRDQDSDCLHVHAETDEQPGATKLHVHVVRLSYYFNNVIFISFRVVNVWTSLMFQHWSVCSVWICNGQFTLWDNVIQLRVRVWCTYHV